MIMKNNRDLYINLMKLILTNYIYGEHETGAALAYQKFGSRFVSRLLKRWNLKLVYNKAFEPKKRMFGQDWPIFAHTMVGVKGLDNLEFCLKEIIQKQIPGDVIEAGVWRGGASIFMKAVLTAYQDKKRTVWVADSFQGLPSPNIKYPLDNTSNLHTVGFLAVSLEEVKNNFRKYNLLDKQVKFLKGWFRDTLPSAPIKQLALIRCDCDMYESTMDVLNNLYSKLSDGGFIIIDDYQTIPACRQAVVDFRQFHDINNKMHLIPNGGLYWQKAF